MKIVTAAAIALAVAAAACTPAETPPAPAKAATISEAGAAAIADATVATWTSMDAARVKALYAPTVIGFDLTVPALSTDRATWNKAQDDFAAAKLDRAEQKQRRIQILDADTFVMSGVWSITSTAKPANDAVVRCTDVFQKDAADKWPIVNEHCSESPKPA